MITYDQQNKFYNQALEIVEKMGGHISAHGNLHGIFLSVIVFHDSTYEKTRDIMDTLQELCGGEIQYHEYWVSKVSFHTLKHLWRILRNLKCWRLLVSYRMMSITVLMMNTMI